MDANSKLLEDRVLEAADRIRELIAERTRLEGELDQMRDPVAVLEKNDAKLSEGVVGQAGADRIRAIAATLQEAIEELRKDG